MNSIHNSHKHGSKAILSDIMQVVEVCFIVKNSMQLYWKGIRDLQFFMACTRCYPETRRQQLVIEFCLFCNNMFPYVSHE